MRTIVATLMCVLTAPVVSAAAEGPALSLPAAETLSLRSRQWTSPGEADTAWRRFLVDPLEVRWFEIRTGSMVGFVPRMRPIPLYPGFLAPADFRVRLDLRPPLPQVRPPTLDDIIGPLPEAVDNPPMQRTVPAERFSLVPAPSWCRPGR